MLLYFILIYSVERHCPALSVSLYNFILSFGVIAINITQHNISLLDFGSQLAGLHIHSYNH